MSDSRSLRERLADEVAANGVGRTCEAIGICSATLKGYLEGGKSTQSRTVAKVYRYFNSKLLDDLRSAIGYDPSTGRSSVGVSLAATLMELDRSRLKAYLHGDMEVRSSWDRDAIERYLSDWADVDSGASSDSNAEGPRWGLAPEELSDYMLDELDALEAQGLADDALRFVPGGIAAASAYASGEWAPYETAREVHLALRCATPIERACPTHDEYIAWQSSHSLPPTPGKAPLPWTCPEYGDSERTRNLMLLEETHSLTYDGVDRLASHIGLPKVNKACPGLNDAMHLATYLEKGGFVSAYLADRIADCLRKIA